ncbi:hypothetical protein F9278_19460 [Streptomyces phaeolivaceus]|uniref:Uncharacterized protein n=1 Tax=Streptomyces phaeolivaceus TaxID=2653200 RepID=A0A5P8K4E9_9ACTN|nr:hypothetical protein [Streptomyces phaeolivaceus]QFQ98031.1 hypothetical protein F9278_19460 [Streptomyces phaeolivaceus]
MRQVDGRGAVFVGGWDVVVCGVLLLVAVGALFFEPGTREEETEAWHLAGRTYGWWFVGGLVLFPVLGMIRTTVVHLVTMIAAPVAAALVLVLPAAR